MYIYDYNLKTERNDKFKITMVSGNEESRNPELLTGVKLGVAKSRRAENPRPPKMAIFRDPRFSEL